MVGKTNKKNRRKEKLVVLESDYEGYPFNRYVSTEEWLTLLNRFLQTTIWVGELQQIVVIYLYWHEHQLGDPTYDERLKQSSPDIPVPYLACSDYPARSKFTISVKRSCRGYGVPFTLLGLISSKTSRMYAVPPLVVLNKKSHVVIDANQLAIDQYHFQGVSVSKAPSCNDNCQPIFLSTKSNQPCTFTEDFLESSTYYNILRDLRWLPSLVNITVNANLLTKTIKFRCTNGKEKTDDQTIDCGIEFVNVPDMNHLHPFVYCNSWKPDLISIQTHFEKYE